MKSRYFIYILFLSFVSCHLWANDSISITGKKYRMDIMVYPHSVGPGTLFYTYRLPDLPLEVAVLEVDAKNPYIKFEACLSKDSIYDRETVASMATRKSYAGHQVIGGINGDFFTMEGETAGMTCNGSMCNGQMGVAPNSFGPMFAFDAQNIPFIDDMRFNGTIAHNGVEETINGVNVARGADQLILYTSLNGKSTRTNSYGTEVTLMLLEGNSFVANRDIACMVKSVSKATGNAALAANEIVISGHGTKAAWLDSFKEGDDVIFHQGISLLSETESRPAIMNMIGSNCVFLKNDLPYDFTSTSGAPTTLNPRTAAGYSADKSKVYFCVVDGRSLLSAGLKTAQLADILSYAGASTAMNFDGGGSSVLLVRGKAGNKPTENRPVANALFAVSVAPEDKNIASIELFSHEIDISYGKTVQMAVSSLNKYGEIVNYKNLSGVTYKVVGDIGTITPEGVYQAAGNEKVGYIEAEFQGLKDRLKVNLYPMKNLKFTISALTIDHLHDYAFVVNGTGEDGYVYTLDNSLLKFKSLDENVGTVSSDGIFRGVSDGTVDIEVSTGDDRFKDTCSIIVEVGKGEKVLDDFTDLASWKILTKDLVDEVNLGSVAGQDGKSMMAVNYKATYQKKTASIEVAKDLRIYGIPQSIVLDMKSIGNKASLALSLDMKTNNTFFLENFYDNTMKSYVFDIPYSNLLPTDYPITIKSIRLTIGKDNSVYIPNTVYENSFVLDKLRVVYEDQSGTNIESELNDEDECLVLAPNPTQGILYLNGKKGALKKVTVYNLMGQPVFTSLNVENKIDINHLMDGIYLCEIITNNNKKLVNKIHLIR